MVRIDVFLVEGEGYYFVPIYIADTLKQILPSRACVAQKKYCDWKEMNDKDFVFSLYPNDLIKITHRRSFSLSKAQKDSSLPDKKEIKSVFLYYASANISTASISGCTHDRGYEIGSLGIKTLVSLEKYTVDVLGTYHKIGKEHRQGFFGRSG